MNKLCDRCINHDEDWFERNGEIEKIPFCLYNQPVFPSAIKCKHFEAADEYSRD